MKRLLLVGGGHAHLHLLAALARRPLAGWRVDLLTPSPRQLYSGMLPGWIAGHYTLAQCAIPLAPLAARAGARLLLDAASGLDAAGRTLRTQQGQTLHYDLLSLDAGGRVAMEAIEGADRHALPVRPMEGFVQGWDTLVRRIHAQCTPLHLVVLGGGAGGLELAMALRHRAMREGWSHLHLTVVGSEPAPLAGLPVAAQQRMLELLRRRCIAWHGGQRAVALTGSELHLADGTRLPCDACWLATGAAAPQWLAGSGLACDEAGFVRVDERLRCLSHPEVFAAGDAAATPWGLPKSGVYAVRAGEYLARSLPELCRGGAPRGWRPQPRALYLLGTGGRHALALWGRWRWEGRWVWRWKDRIDRRFVASFAPHA